MGQPKAGNDVLCVQGVGKRYRDRQIIQDVSVQIERGRVIGLLGPNGAGKTTLFYIIMGLVTPDTGKIFLDGQDVTSLPMYQRARLGVGYLPQEASIFRKLTVEANIMAILEFRRLKRTLRQARLESLLQEFSLTHIRGSLGASLSGGERRRCEIARALAYDPLFILLDEPFAGVDPMAVKDIHLLVRHLTKRGVGVLITDHNVRETLSLVDWAYIIHEGHVLKEGIPAEVIKNQDVRALYLGNDFEI